MRKTGPSKVTLTLYFCSPCRYLHESQEGKTGKNNPIGYQMNILNNNYYCFCNHKNMSNIEESKKKIDHKKWNTPEWCPVLQKRKG